MSFNTQQLVSATLDLFGGYCSEMNPADLPDGASPWCQDVEFSPGSVFTRRGLGGGVFSTLVSGNVNYLKSYETSSTDTVTLVLDSTGALWVEDLNFPGVLSLLDHLLPGSRCKSSTWSGTEYMAFSNGQWGTDIPRQYDGTYFDRVSQDGPGAAPNASDEKNSYTVAPSSGGVFQYAANNIVSITPAAGNLVTLVISGSFPPSLAVNDGITIAGTSTVYDASWTVTEIDGTSQLVFLCGATNPPALAGGGTVTTAITTVVTTMPNSFVPGQLVLLSDPTVSAYDGEWTIRQIINTTTFVVSVGASNLAAAGGGAVSAAGLISAGQHQLTVMFLTRKGYVTAPATPTFWQSGGNLRVVVTNIPIGPANVVARILAFTPANSDFFSYVPVPTTGSDAMVIPDNTTTSVTLDFSDVTLQAATAIDIAGNNLFDLVTLGPCLGVTSYADRLFWWGELNKVQNFVNMSFDGGFQNSFAPLGWLQDEIYGAGGVQFGDSVNPSPVVFGFAYGMQGRPADPAFSQVNRGLIYQTAYQDADGVPILLPSTAYSMRVRLAVSGPVLTFASQFVVELYSLSGGAIAVATVSAALIHSTPVMQSFSVPFSANTPAVIPSDTVLRIYSTFPKGTDASTIVADELDIFPTEQPYNVDQVRVSYVENPESFDGLTGVISPAQSDGLAVTRLFLLRSSLYISTTGTLSSTSDPGQLEPSGWTVSLESNTVGTPSVYGGDTGEEWDVTASQTGLYMFNGSEPLKINQEISHSLSGLTVAWDQINWEAGFTIWVVNDVTNRQIYIGVPVGPAVFSPNQILMVDYKELQTSYNIASEGPIHTSYAGKLISWEPGRKWSPWNIAAPCGAMILRTDGSVQTMLGNNVGNGKVYQLTVNANDDGQGINSFWVTSPVPSAVAKQQPQVGTERCLFTLLRMFISGSGLLSITCYPSSLTNTQTQSYAVPLPATPTGNLECPIRVAGERMFVKMATDGQPNSRFQLTEWEARLRSHPWSRIRHVN